ncbi:hypothetical protein LF1_02660 [Rubripirellula obstinata]|uniref:Probable inorganic carbon transporter subunit DabA n=1 Tax=Rubripirellula obstinata TaxID=406547 RepID=A0A5B1CB38_9BACT|nr:DUF2309 domain-containing protein [Rubripirellula obstinata]KAA1257776.1 hypothetical protein LF1_02660 [Rubripirellula obstinata]
MQPQIEHVLSQVATVISPVWPLKDYVAVNPYFGISDRSFLDGRTLLQSVSDCETLMPLSYYSEQYARQQFSISDIESAIAELGLGDQVQADAVIQSLSVPVNSDSANQRSLRTISEMVDSSGTTKWNVAIRDEVSKFCASHYDEGQAVWVSPWKGLPLFEAWRSMAVIDRNMESNGLTGFRAFVAELPETADEAIVWLLQRLNVPENLWESFLLCQAFSMPGWSAWAKYQTHWTDEAAAERNDLSGLLAIRLAYDVAVSEWSKKPVDWDSISSDVSAAAETELQDDTAFRYVLLRASEIAFRDNLLDSLSTENHGPSQTDRKLAQLVFCIDVRSERIRRQLESQSPDIETFGFAGFFGMPIEFIPMGQAKGDSHLPVLLKPQFKLHEGLHESESPEEHASVDARIKKRSWRKLWKRFQTSAVGCFSFVETVGLFYGFSLFKSAIGFGSKDDVGKFDGVADSDHDHLGPTLRGLDQQGMTTSHQIDLAQGMLTNLGLINDFARLVAFCGHTSQTENNPLAAGLDCGACGGHSGEPNARFAAALLNQPFIRTGLAERGIQIPEDTHFLGGVHNTTTDQISFFDLDELPASLQGDLSELINHAAVAGKQTRTERMPIVASKTMRDVMRRAVDWSEVRPEWGLAGNAAFIVGPRWMTKQANLDGRSFLHSYEHQNDPEGAVLEGIMTAPMVVANWINMQYYASTVDNDHFGSGNKTVHNVVGRFGILSGNSGDLMTGLPMQSLHTGEEYQHLPMRLQSIIAAPRESIDRVIAKHELVRNLLDNGWLHLIAIDDGISYRYANSDWQVVAGVEQAV